MEHQQERMQATSVGSTFAWLLIPMALATGLYVAAGRLSGPELRRDTESYLNVVKNGLFTAESLQSPRTIGYPLFVAAVQGVFGSLAPVPILQWTIFCAAVFFFAFALLRIGSSRGLCVFLTAPLFFSDVAAGYLPVVIAEVPAVALAIASMAAVVLATSEPTRRRWWMVLALTIFLSYQFRPAFLFLVAIVPLLAFLIDPVLRGGSRVAKNRGQIVARATAAVAVPLVGFCLLRLVVVGNFGLVSFAGTNLVGITGSILDQERLAKLSPEIRPLAERMLQIRKSSEMRAVERERHARWDQAVHRRYGLDLPNYTTIDRLYNPTIHEVAYPAATKLYGDDQIAAERAFSQLSLEMIALRPVTYAGWVAFAFFHAISTALVLYATLGLTMMAACTFLARLLLEGLVARHAAIAPRTLPTNEWIVFRVVATVTIAFFCAKALLVALVEPTLARYVRPAAIFLPTIPAMVAYCQVRRFVQTCMASAIGSSKRVLAGNSETI
jgi:hypothetical protein